MNLTDESFQVGHMQASANERARLRCRRAKELQEAGKYAEACDALGELWQGTLHRPCLEGLEAEARAEVLLRAGALAGFVGSARQTGGAQEFAKNLISESSALFAAASKAEREAEALRELAYCYWREGAFDEARVMLHESLARLTDGSGEEKAQTLLRLAIVESSATRYRDALDLLQEAAPLFDASANHAKRGTFHMELAVVLQTLYESERRKDYAERALIEYAAASFHFDEAEHARYRAAAENNLVHLLLRCGRYAEAHEHLDCARRLFASLRDAARVAQVDETRARLLLAEGRAAEAEAAARAAVEAHEGGDEQAILAEALTTHGVALARAGRNSEAREVLRRASATAERAGVLEGAGLAELAALEELNDLLPHAEALALYASADELLAHTQHPETLTRLRAAARRLLATARAAHAGGGTEQTDGGGTQTLAARFAADACARYGKRVRFTAGALAAMGRLALAGGADELRSLIERTVERAADGATVEAGAVETVALRQLTEGADFIDPWANFSFKGEVKCFEERLIERALHDARGRVSHAARLLGFRHHESLNWRLKNRNKGLLPARTPARRRHRSIIRKFD